MQLETRLSGEHSAMKVFALFLGHFGTATPIKPTRKTDIRQAIRHPRTDKPLK